MSSDTGSSPTTKECYRCGHVIPADAQRCPSCGRRQYRICYCGNRINVTLSSCPHCNADWSSSRRTRRTKHRSSKVQPGAVAKSAGIGALAALGMMGIFQVLVRYFARIGAETGDIPEAMSARMQMAATGVHKVIEAWLNSIAARSDALLGVGIGLLIGAAIGVSIYLINIGIIKFNRKKSRTGSRTSRRRRV